MTKNETRQVRIDNVLYEKAQQRAKELGLNFSSYVRFLISQDTGKTNSK